MYNITQRETSHPSEGLRGEEAQNKAGPDVGSHLLLHLLAELQPWLL